jgi:APA family basic amino acid/polyamine antiporter
MSTNTSGAKKIGLLTTSAFVIANMVGTGVFTSLGFQLNGTSNIVTIMILWILGGVIALCGALVYSELVAAMPRSGGEYHYLSKIYHRWLGFLSGWVSLTVGFAAPVALAAMALGKYSSNLIPDLSFISHEHVKTIIAISVISIVSIIHAYDVKVGGNFQNVFTSFKIILILVFICCGLFLTPKLQNLTPTISAFSFKDLLQPGFYVSIIWVCYAYSGWNASAYIANEIDQPQKNIPKSIFMSTILVTVLYVFLNLTFMLTAPASEMMGKEDVGYVSANYIFGATGGNIMALLISILLISTISSMIFVGPRVSQVMGEDLKLFRFLSVKSKRGIPVYAIFLQFIISLILIVTSTFDSVLSYSGFTLNLILFLTVFGVFVHRAKYKDIERPYKTWGYPVIPIIYLLIMLLTMGYFIYDKPLESTLGFITVLSGSILYGINFLMEKKVSLAKIKQ